MTEAPPGRGRLAARVLAVVIRLAVAVGSRVPTKVAHGLAVVGGNLEWLARPGKRRRLAANLGVALDLPAGDRAVGRVVRQEIVNEARRSADLLWALGRPEEFLASCEYVGIDHVVDASADGGVILAGVHVGGWEVATAVPADVLDAPAAVVVADDWLAWAIEHARVAAGLRVLYPAEAALASTRHLRKGGALLVLGDDPRFATHRVEVRFLGRRVALAGGPAALARLAQVPIVTFHVLPLGPRRWRVTVDAPVAPPAPGSGAAGERAVLQELADRWTDVIRAHPEHWAAVYDIDWR